MRSRRGRPDSTPARGRLPSFFLSESTTPSARTYWRRRLGHDGGEYPFDGSTHLPQHQAVYARLQPILRAWLTLHH